MQGASGNTPMLGATTHYHRGKNFWYCCPGHDHYSKSWKDVHKRPRRAAERREWKREIDNE